MTDEGGWGRNARENAKPGGWTDEWNVWHSYSEPDRGWMGPHDPIPARRPRPAHLHVVPDVRTDVPSATDTTPEPSVAPGAVVAPQSTDERVPGGWLESLRRLLTRKDEDHE